MNITRRDALLGAGGALGGAAVLLAEKDATASPVQDPLVHLWQKRSQFMSEADRLADEASAIERTLPGWARNFSGIVIEVPGCQPKTCRTDKAVAEALGFRGMPVRYLVEKNGQAEWRRKEKLYRDGRVADLERVRQRFDHERERAGYTAKNAECDAMMDRALEIEGQIVDTQAVTMEGLLVQALFSAELEQENEPKFLTTRLGKSMGIAARRMAPGLAQAERLAGGMPS